jgi:hypothetical protein
MRATVHGSVEVAGSLSSPSSHSEPGASKRHQSGGAMRL